MPRNKQHVAVPKSLVAQVNAEKPKQTKPLVQNIEKSRVAAESKAVKKALRKKAKGNKRQLLQAIPLALDDNQSRTVGFKCTLDTVAFRLAFIALASWLAQKGIINNRVSTGVESPWNSVYGGLTNALRGAGTMVQGGTADLSAMPKVLADFIQALQPKEAPMSGFGKAAYGWNEFSAADLDLGTLANGAGTWACTYVDGVDDGTPTSPGIVWVPTGQHAEEYSQFLKLVADADYHQKLRIVDGDYKSALHNDVSAYARVYPYVGLQSTKTGGFWKNIESEVNITSPQFSNFVAYDYPDTRVPRRLTPSSGDASQCLVAPLLKLPYSHFNKSPFILKQLDFEHYYVVLIRWMSRLKEVACASVGGGKYATDPLPFSMQDFRIALRQAILSTMPHQCMVQELGTMSRENASTFFAPFKVMGTTYGHPAFKKLEVPCLLAENHACLLPRSIKFTKSKHNSTNYMSVIGKYTNDNPVWPQFDTGNGVMTDLFTQGLNEQVINLIDGTSGATDTYINLNNSYYQSVIENWNFYVAKLRAFSVDTQPLASDSGAAGEGILYFTRLLNSTQGGEDSSAAPPKTMYHLESINGIKNNGVPKKSAALEKQDSKAQIIKKPKEYKAPMALGPATVLTSTISSTTSIRPLIAEEQGFYDSIIVPSVRLSDDGLEDVLTEQMYCTITGECIQTYYASSLSQGGVSLYSRLDSYAGMCVKGFAADSDTMYDETRKHLQKLNQAGALSLMLSGIAKQVFPSASGLIDTIASISPL